MSQRIRCYGRTRTVTEDIYVGAKNLQLITGAVIVPPKEPQRVSLLGGNPERVKHLVDIGNEPYLSLTKSVEDTY